VVDIKAQWHTSHRSHSAPVWPCAASLAMWGGGHPSERAEWASTKRAEWTTTEGCACCSLPPLVSPTCTLPHLHGLWRGVHAGMEPALRAAGHSCICMRSSAQRSPGAHAPLLCALNSAAARLVLNDTCAARAPHPLPHPAMPLCCRRCTSPAAAS